MMLQRHKFSHFGLVIAVWFASVAFGSITFGNGSFANFGSVSFGTARADDTSCADFRASAPTHVQLLHTISLSDDMLFALMSALRVPCDLVDSADTKVMAAVETALLAQSAPLLAVEAVPGDDSRILTLNLRTDRTDMPVQALLLPVTIIAAESENPLKLAELVGTNIEGEVLNLRYLVEESSPALQTGRLQVVWRRDGVVINEASGGRYQLQAADVGASISAEISLLDSNEMVLHSLQAAPTSKVAMAEYPPEAVDIVIAGEAVVGGELVVSYRFVDPNPEDSEAAPDIIWIRDNEVIAGAKGDRLILSDADIGKKITVRVLPRSSDGQSGKAALATLPDAVVPKPVMLAEDLQPAPVETVDTVETVDVADLPKPVSIPLPTSRPDRPKTEARKDAETPPATAGADSADDALPKPKLAPKPAPKPAPRTNQPPPPPPIELTAGLTRAANGPDTVRDITFTPTGIISDLKLAKLTADFIGLPIGLETIRDILNAVNTAYREEGYELSRALLPEQHIDDGVVTIQMVDARIGKIAFENRYGLKEDFLLEQLGLTEGDFIDLAKLEIAIRRYNANNKSKLTSELAAGEGFGETDVFIDVSEPDRIELPSVSINNYNNEISDWQQNSFSTTFNNLTGRDDELTITLSDSNGSVSQGAVFSMPVNSKGTNVTLSHTSNQTKSTAGSADTVGYRGSSRASGLALSHPLIFNDEYSMYLSASLGQSYADLVQPVTDILLSKSQTRKLSLGLPMSYSTGLTTISFSPVWSLIHTETQIPITSNWVQKVEADLALAQYVNPYLTMNLKSKMLYSGAESMINMPAETLTVGGPSSVRAYQPSESSGYQGYFVSGELRTDLANWDNMTMPAFAPSIQPYVFVDHAMAQTQFKKRIRADYWSGAGVGVSIPSLFNFFTFDAYWAHPLDGDVHEAEKEAYEDELFQFSLSAKFRLQ